MGAERNEAVIAGSRAFALALLPQLTQRVGTRPRVAVDPETALALCRGGGGLVVLEYEDDRWMPAIEELARAGTYRIVVALPDVCGDAAEGLRAAGATAVPWAGDPAPVVNAVAAAVPRAAARPAAAAVPPPPAPVRPSTPATSRPAAPAAAPAAAPPVAAAAPVRAPAPVATAPRPGATPAAAAGARPPPPPPAALPTAPPARGVALAPPLPPPAPPAASPVAPASPAPPAPVATAPAPPAPLASPATAPAPASVAAIFDDVEHGDEDIDVSFEPAPPRSEPGPVAGPAADAGAWPGSIPGPVAAEETLAAAIDGAPFAPGLAPVAQAVVAGMTELERAALRDEPLPFEAAPVRRAAVMRLRVAVALATVPAPGTPADAGAVSALLAEIDELLSKVNELLAGAPEGSRDGLLAVRNALVKEAIDFSEATSRLAPAGAPAVASGSPSARAPQARVLSMESVPPPDAAESRRRRVLVLGLAAAALVAVAYHGWRLTVGPAVPSGPVVQGAPAGVVGSEAGPGGPKVLMSPDGAVDAEALKRFQEEQRRQGNEVKELAPGVMVVQPRSSQEK